LKEAAVRAVSLVAVSAVFALGGCSRSKAPAADTAQEKVEVAPPASRFPAGISEVRFGQVERVRRPGEGQTCTIPQPLPEPAVFPAGVRELAFTASLDPEIVKDADATLTGPGLPEVRGTGCNAYTVSAGRLLQTQIGSSFVRSDGGPWPAGAYELSVRVNGASTTFSFRVE
jgi:hypothetical protein